MFASRGPPLISSLHYNSPNHQLCRGTHLKYVRRICELDALQSKNVEHDIITRDANSVSWAEITDFSKW